jgi:hypothetical protein
LADGFDGQEEGCVEGEVEESPQVHAHGREGGWMELIKVEQVQKVLFAVLDWYLSQLLESRREEYMRTYYDQDTRYEKASKLANIDCHIQNLCDCQCHSNNTLTYDDQGQESQSFHEMRMLETESFAHH